MKATAQRIIPPTDDALPAVDMTDEGYRIALAYSGDASWQSIRLLREDILRSIWMRR